MDTKTTKAEEAKKRNRSPNKTRMLSWQTLTRKSIIMKQAENPTR